MLSWEKFSIFKSRDSYIWEIIILNNRHFCKHQRLAFDVKLYTCTYGAFGSSNLNLQIRKNNKNKGIRNWVHLLYNNWVAAQVEYQIIFFPTVISFRLFGYYLVFGYLNRLLLLVQISVQVTNLYCKCSVTYNNYWFKLVFR